MSEIRYPFLHRNVSPEQIEIGQQQIFNNYLNNLGLKKEWLQNKQILDVGANSGSFGDVASRFGAQVVSIDEMRPKDWQDVASGQSKKFFEVTSEDLRLKDKMGLEEEPQFDFVLSHFSTPYVLINEGQDKNGRWKDSMSDSDRFKHMYDKISKTINNIFLHLKANGRAIIYPLFLNLDSHEAANVDFSHGEKRDVRQFNKVIHSVLSDIYNSYGDSFVLTTDEIPQNDGTSMTRLTIVRKI